jgi:hypothetical protein
VVSADEYRLLFENCTDSGNVPVSDFIDEVFEFQDGVGDRGYLAQVVKAQPGVDMVNEPASPKFAGTIDEYRELHKGDEALQERLRNKIKQCQCGKACAYTMTHCNACGRSLAASPISYNDNVFTSFILGIARGKFPFAISMRAQSSNMLCFDDPLSMAACHFNCIPTDVYVPDMRFLFTDPAKGLLLVNRIFDYAATACLKQFWGNDAFRQKVFCDERAPSSPKELFGIVTCGLNFPPSMYQLHLQFIHPPFLPMHHVFAIEGKHLTKDRFFPLEFLVEALSLGDKVKVVADANGDIDLDEILRKAEALGVSYNRIHKRMMRKYKAQQRRFGSYAEDEFECLVKGGEVRSRDTGSVLPSANADAIMKEDRLILQNYGRPYKEPNNDKSSCTYYKFAKDPAEISDFAAWEPAPQALDPAAP